MPRRVRKSNRPLRRRRVNRRARVARPLRYNPRPVFTETVRLQAAGSPGSNYVMNSNLGGCLQVNMDMIPQLSQYSNLYTKYRILKVTYMALGTWNTQSSDINAGQYNVFQAQPAYGMGRVAFVIQDSPFVAAPVNEQDVLTCNGAKVISAKPKFSITTRPVPNIVDALSNQLTLRKQFINFTSAPGAQNTTHGSVKWFYTLPVIAPNPQIDPFYQVYAKITFQLADPR